MNVFNTHLCARTDVDGRADQLEAMLAYIRRTEATVLAGNPSVIGGDFNFDLFDNQGAEKFLWQRVRSAGFIDAYADHAIASSAGQETLDSLCEDEDNADEHCTVGVSELNGHNARRVDYVFARDPSSVLDAKVVFNSTVNEGQHSVSDHAGVFIRLELN
jgi:maltose 6'-phosphate phosphatase